MADSLDEWGLLVGNRQEASTIDRIVGYAPVARPATFRLPPTKLAMLYEALMFFVSRQWVEVDLVRSALGMWVWAALLRRETLSIPAVVFQFTRELAGTCSCWWPSARREVRAMAAVLPLMWADVGAPISNLCLATDACGATESHNGAYGIVAAVLPAAMTRSIFEAGTAIGFTVPRADGDLSGLRRPEKALAATKPHTTLASSLFDARTRWSDIEHGK